MTTRKSQFIAPDGRPLHLKGINLGNWLLPEGYMFKFESASSPRLIHTVINQLIGEAEAAKFWNEFRNRYITREDIRFIKQAGFNSVRVPFHYGLLVRDDETHKLEGAGYELLDSVIRWCSEENLYVILDMHAAPGGQTGDNIDDSYGYPFLFESPENQALTIKIWRTLAARYKDSTTVLGYDLLNEPIAHFFDTQTLNPKLEPLYRRMVAAIREVDKNHIIFLGGAQWNSNFKIFNQPFDDNLAYTFHKYWTEPTQSVIQEYLDFSNQYQVPLWMGESGENTDEWIKTFRTTLEKNGVGWCFWPYKKLDAASGVVSIKPPADWEAIIKFANHPRATFEDVRKNRPPKEKVVKALSDYLEAIKFTNCRINQGYLQALGLK
ncbi:MAG: glycoside hydrolase family 5 protein [Acidobacteriota bacterium]